MKKYIFFWAIVTTVGIISCSNKASSTRREIPPLAESTTFHHDPIENNKIKITIDDKSFLFKLANNKTAVAYSLRDDGNCIPRQSLL